MAKLLGPMNRKCPFKPKKKNLVAKKKYGLRE